MQVFLAPQHLEKGRLAQRHEREGGRIQVTGPGDFAAVRVQDPSSLGAKVGQARVDVDLRPVAVAAADERDHVVPKRVVIGEAAQRLAGERDHAVKQAAALFLDAGPDGFRLAPVGVLQDPGGRAEEDQEAAEQEEEPEADFHARAVVTGRSFPQGGIKGKRRSLTSPRRRPTSGPAPPRW